MTTKTYEVTQTAHFIWRVEANSPEEAVELSRQLGYEDAWCSYADDVEPDGVQMVAEDDI